MTARVYTDYLRDVIEMLWKNVCSLQKVCSFPGLQEMKKLFLR